MGSDINWFKCPNEGTDPRPFRWITCPLQNLFSYPSDTGYESETSAGLHKICQGPFFLCLNFALPPVTKYKYYTFRIGTRYDKNAKLMIRPEIISKFTLIPLYY